MLSDPIPIVKCEIIFCHARSVRRAQEHASPQQGRLQVWSDDGKDLRPVALDGSCRHRKAFRGADPKVQSGKPVPRLIDHILARVVHRSVQRP